MVKNDLGLWPTQPNAFEKRARKLAGEAYDAALEARAAFDVSHFEYWRGIVDGVQRLLDDGTETPLLKELNGYSETLRNVGPAYLGAAYGWGWFNDRV